MYDDRKRARDILCCLKRIESFSDGQAFIQDWDMESMRWVKVQIRPNSGLYNKGKFDFQIFMSKGYPKCPPLVSCLTRIYHPNIDPSCDSENVCLNLLDEWTSQFGLEDIIQGLLFLLHNPNLDDPLVSIPEDTFEALVPVAMKGEDNAEFHTAFDRVLVDGSESAGAEMTEKHGHISSALVGLFPALNEDVDIKEREGREELESVCSDNEEEEEEEEENEEDEKIEEEIRNESLVEVVEPKWLRIVNCVTCLLQYEFDDMNSGRILSNFSVAIYSILRYVHGCKRSNLSR